MSSYFTPLSFPSAASKHLPKLYVDTIGLFNKQEIPSITEAQRNDNPKEFFKDTFYFGYNTDHSKNWAFVPHPLAKQNELSYS